MGDRSVPRESRGRELVRAIAALTSAELPLRELFGKLAAALIEAFGGAIVVVATATPEGTRIEYAYREGAPEAEPGQAMRPDPTIEQVIGSSLPVLYCNAQDWPGAAPRRARADTNRATGVAASAMFVPILFVGKCVGVLSVQSFQHDAYDHRDVGLLEACALYVGARMENERGREEASRLERIATTDALTGLANRRAFDATLDTEWKRCRRHALPLSLLLIDVDFFKQFNDEYGHVTGDACLRDVARALEGAAKRPGDLAARYGGEEFALVLPGTDRPGAIALAESFRSAVAQLQIPHRGSSLGSVTVSIGAATIAPEEHGASIDEIVRRADALLYAAKTAGRNRTSAQGFGSLESVVSQTQAAAPPATMRRDNLPLPPTSFVGRETELAEALRLLASSTLLTLAGHGGVGKTRMALRLASESLERFPDGVWFADLSPLTEPELVPSVVLAAMRVREAGGADATATLLEHLGDRRALVVLDNCEHVIASAAALADTVHRTCPNVTVLATSREPLTIQGETVYRLGSMSDGESVRLFAERATAVSPSFAAASRNEEAVARICRRLDGLPLAIELAAARVRMMPVEQIWEHLDDRFALLKGGSRTAQPRQQTLYDLIAWSYDLLSNDEKTLFRRLSSLVSEWPIEAAIGIGAGAPIDETGLFDLLSQLVDKSLIAVNTSGETARYRSLESTRAFGLDRAREAGDFAETAQRHAAYWRDYAVATESTWETPGWSAARKDLRRNYDNLRAALSWSIAERRDLAGGAALAIALELYWSDAGAWPEGRYWYEQALSAGAGLPANVRGRLHLGASGMALLRGDVAAMRTQALAAIEAFESIGDATLLARARADLSIVHFYAGEYAESKAQQLAVLDLWRKLGDRLRESIQLANLAELTAGYELDFEAADRWYRESIDVFSEHGTLLQRAIVLSDWSETAGFMGDYDRALDLIREALTVFEESGAQGRAWEAGVRLATLLVHQGHPERARPVLHDALERFTQSMQHDYLARGIDAACELAAATGSANTGARLAGFADAWRTSKNIARSPARQRVHDRALASLESALGTEAFAKGHDAGRTLTPDKAVELALEVSTS